MLFKASFVTLALTLVTSANLVAKESDVSIDLPRRATLTKADGTFDHEAAILSNIKTHKYVHALITGSPNTILMYIYLLLQQVPEELAQLAQ